MLNPLSRREVLRFGAFTTVGGVLTPGISLAQAIVTDTKGIVARDVQLQVGGTAIPAYDARPEKAGRYPIVVVISGFTGNNEQNKDIVRRFAQAGFYAIAPELYHREGGMQGKNFQEMGQIADKIKSPVMGLYGEADPGIPADDVKRFEAELKKRGVAAEFILYPGAGHAFFSDDRPQVYKKEASEDAWTRCVAFFDKYLKA